MRIQPLQTSRMPLRSLQSGDRDEYVRVHVGEIVRGFFQSGYAGWRTNVECSRQGYAFEGVTALLDMAFSSHVGLGPHRVQANVIPENLPSIRLAERVGFRKEGVALRYLKIAGKWQDHVMFAKLAEEHVPTYLSPES